MYDVMFILILGVVLLVVLAALIGFLYTQLKAPPLWRLLSLAVVIVFCSWACYHFGKSTTYMNVNENYVRGIRMYIPSLDELVVAGHTNDVHQSLVRFQRAFSISDDPSDVSNFWDLVGDTFNKADRLEMYGSTNQP